MRKIQTILTILGGAAALILLILGLLVYSYTQTKTRTQDSAAKTNANTQVSQSEAVEKVRMRTEVQKYEFELARLGSKAVIEAEDLGEDWNVHVFEIVSQAGSSHTATFNWYTVNKKTGEVVVQTP
ncbi:MAG: hypothetical protein AAB410_05665 [Patescibacteria group bacterium]